MIDFGAFVDIGVHQDGLVHVSQISDKFIKNPRDALKVGDVVQAVSYTHLDVYKRQARQCEANGADLIAVHGRTREQMYIPPIDVDAITEIRKAVGIPVLANGDITTCLLYTSRWV